MTRTSFGKGALLGGIFALAASIVLGGVAAPAQAATRIKYVSKYSFGDIAISGSNGTSTTLGNGGSLLIQGIISGNPYPHHVAKAHVVIQRKVGSGAWKTVKKNITYKGYTIETMTPAYSSVGAKTTVSYRFGSLKYKTTKKRGVAHSTYSKAFKFTYENQKFYTGLAQQAYNDAKPYCPNTAIHISTVFDGRSGYYNTGALVLNISSTVSDMSSRANQATVPIHECTHERQFINYGETYAGQVKMLKAMDKYFVNDSSPDGTQLAGSAYSFNAQEHAADCAALSVNPDGYLGYGGYCNPSELAAGNKLLLGGKLT